MENMFFIEFQNGMWLIRSGAQYIGGYPTRQEALEFAIRRAERKGFSTQVLLAGEDRLFQTVWAGGKAHCSLH
jgi:hypothetical protein